MSMVVADVPAVHDASDPARALFTLAVLTGVIMLAAGLLRLGSVLRFVSNAVMVGFLSAVGVNIVFGQLANFTGYQAQGANRVVRAVATLLHPTQLHLQTLAIGATTIALILLLERTRLGALALVVAVIVASAAAAALGWVDVATLNELAIVPRSLPLPEAPMLRLAPQLVVPALSLAFIGLVQGAGISANFPNPDGRYPDASRDFVGQGAANLAAGVFQGMPVGGSLSATALNKQAGARSRQALVIAGLAMAVVIVAFAGVVGNLAMPSLAGLLMLIGYRTIKPADLGSVWRTGAVQKVVLVTTFALTMLIPLQYAVLVGVGLSVLLHVVRQSNQVTIKRRQIDPEGNVIETDPPARLRPKRWSSSSPTGACSSPRRRSLSSAPRPRRHLPAFRGDLAAPRTQRPRDHLHGRALPVRPRPRHARLQARHRVRQPADPGATRRHRDHRPDRRREPLYRRRAGGRNRETRPRRRDGMACGQPTRRRKRRRRNRLGITSQATGGPCSGLPAAQFRKPGR
jgi:sulfate permease, SulP family